MEKKNIYLRISIIVGYAVIVILFIVCLAYPKYIVQEKQVVYIQKMPQKPVVTQRIVKETIIEKEIIYVPEFKPWNSKPELLTWLNKNDISNNLYNYDVYDCDDFAMNLSLAAAIDGYYIGIKADKIDGQWHMENFAVIGNYAYKINPQTDYTTYWMRLD